MHFSVAEKARCGRGGDEERGGGDEEDGRLTESVSMIMKCILGSPWRDSDDAAALYEEFCHRMKEVGKREQDRVQWHYTEM